jgi:hypothetical protein
LPFIYLGGIKNSNNKNSNIKNSNIKNSNLFINEFNETNEDFIMKQIEFLSQQRLLDINNRIHNLSMKQILKQ